MITRRVITRRGLGLAARLTALLMVLLVAACTPITPEPTQGSTAEPTTSATAPTDTATADTAADDMATHDATGIYKGIFPGASSPGLDATLYLNADGSMRLVSDYLNDEPPQVETGTWTADGATVTVAGDQLTDSLRATLTLEGDQLVTDNWIGPWFRLAALAQGMTPPYDAEMAAQMITEREFLGYYKHFAPSASCCGREMTLLLGIEQMVRLTTDYHNGEAPIVETGDWSINDDGSVTVRLTGRADGALYEAPNRFTLTVEDGMLNAVAYDQSIYGTEKIRFYLYPAIALATVQAAQ